MPARPEAAPAEALSHEQALRRLVLQTPWFMRALRAAQSLGLPAWCIGAGAVRNLVWDALHGHQQPSELADVDLAHFDPTRDQPGDDAELQARLCELEPGLPWEVTNQAFVHTWFEAHFGHAVPPLRSLHEAVASWPEYATAVGVFIDAAGQLQLIAPHGLDDLFKLRVQRNPLRVSVETYRARVAQKQYTKRWPRVTVLPS